MSKKVIKAAVMAVMLSAGLFCIVACQKDNEKTDGEQQAADVISSKTLSLSDAEREQIAQDFAAALDGASEFKRQI